MMCDDGGAGADFRSVICKSHNGIFRPLFVESGSLIMKADASQVVEILRVAAEENQVCSLRMMQTITLPEQGEVWMTGDIHDHRRNFEKLVRAADLANNPQRHLVLHELIHGDHYDSNGAEDSWQMLAQAAELKGDYPAQVHFLLANHDLAQIYGEGIMKAGLSVCEAFTAGVRRDFGDQAELVCATISEFLLSFPLAVRAENGLFFSHSLPSEAQVDLFDYTVFDRPLEGKDYQRRTGPVYQLIWGRGITPQGSEIFAANVEARLIITGHQPQDMGYAINGKRHLIIASDHNQGVYVPLSLDHEYTMEEVVDRITKFVTLP